MRDVSVYCRTRSSAFVSGLTMKSSRLAAAGNSRRSRTNDITGKFRAHERSSRKGCFATSACPLLIEVAVDIACHIGRHRTPVDRLCFSFKPIQRCLAQPLRKNGHGRHSDHALDEPILRADPCETGRSNQAGFLKGMEYRFLEKDIVLELDLQPAASSAVAEVRCAECGRPLSRWRTR